MLTIRTLLTVLATSTIALSSHAAPLGSAFTYQGKLEDAGTLVTDVCDFEFRLWDANAGGMEVAPAVAVPGVSVNDGAFAVSLDFGGSAFSDEARWLEISVACPAGGRLTRFFVCSMSYDLKTWF